MPPRHHLCTPLHRRMDAAAVFAATAATGVATVAGLSALALLPLPARADGGTASSLMSRQAAIQQATLWMPPGAQITSTNCTDMVIDSSIRYFCSVQWGPAVQ